MRIAPVLISCCSHAFFIRRRYAGVRRWRITSRTRTSVEMGAVAGVVGGVVSAVLLQLARMTTTEGVREPAMGLVAGAVHTARTPLAWLGYLVYAAIIGGVFGWLLKYEDAGAGDAVWGLLYGGFWWIVSGLVIIPALYGIGPMTPGAVDVIRGASLPWFVAMLLDGVVLGIAYALLMHRRPPAEEETSVVTRRAA